MFLDELRKKNQMKIKFWILGFTLNGWLGRF